MNVKGGMAAEEAGGEAKLRGAKDAKGGLFSGMKSFFKLSKNEQRQRKAASTKAKKLPKDFANQVLEYELKIDSGRFDVATIDKLMQLYSVSTMKK